MSLRLISPLLCLAFSANLIAQTCNDYMPASTPDDRFTINQNGTVTDVRTGLIWKRCLVGQTGIDCSGTDSTRTWNEFRWGEALQHAAEQTGWRLPNIKELSSIVELKCAYPAINLTVFPNDPGSYVWSSSPYADEYNYTWSVNFFSGEVNYAKRNTYKRIRLVRDR